MATIDDQRHRMIRTVIMRRPDAVGDVSLRLWECLASELTSIIGDGGFQSLYARSIHLARAQFSFIPLSEPTLSIACVFANLKKCLEERDLDVACEASITLLNIFIDILILLIGELLTTSILRSAWGDDAMNIAGTELQ